MRIGLPFPEHREMLTLGVVFQTGKVNACLFPNGIVSRFDRFHQISARADLYDLAKC